MQSKEKEVKNIVFFTDGNNFKVVEGDSVVFFNGNILNARDLEQLLKDIPYIDYAVNIDKEASLASKFNVKSIPTVIFFKDGAEVARIVGAVAQSEVSKKIDSLL